MKKKYLPLLLSLTIIVLLIVGGYSFRQNAIKINPLNPEKTVSGLTGVPIYPGASFVKQENTSTCSSLPDKGQRAKMFLSCDSIQYSYSTKDGFNNVVNWYISDESKSGWRLHGGGGSEGSERYGSLSNKDKIYWITIGIDRTTGKEFTYFEIRVSQISANTEATNWKTYTNTKFNYSVKYPLNLKATDETIYSELFNVVQTQPGPAGFPNLYISIIPNGFTNSDSTIYNFMSDRDINTFFTMRIDGKHTQKNVYPEFWTYTKLPDTTVDNQKGFVVENSKVWGGSNELRDRRIFVKRNGFTYEFGAYYQNTDEFNTFQKFLSTFKFTQ